MCLPSLMRQVPKSGSIVALLIVFNFIQRYCLNKFGRHTTLPLTGCIASGSDKVKPHVLSAVYTFGLMC